MNGHVTVQMEASGPIGVDIAREALCALAVSAAKGDMIVLPETLSWRRVSPTRIEWQCDIRQAWIVGRVSLAGGQHL